LTKVRRLALVVSLVALTLPAVADARAFGSRTLDRGSTGSDVRTLQQLLTGAGYATTADGVFGRATARSVKAWEADADRRVDGRVTPRDARALKAEAGSSGPVEEPVPDDTVKGDKADRERNPRQTGGASYVKVTNGFVTKDGLAVAPDDAPQAVKDIIDAGNEIAKKPYRYGGGHGKWKDSGYDCSGSVSYALHFAGLLKRPLDSTGFESYGAAGPGNWVTIYANSGHAYMVVAGLRFDTSAHKQGGSRWTEEMRSSRSYVARHPAGL
jgi:cell wall-associated NlpC family hydrolase